MYYSEYDSCILCPRKCRVNRNKGEYGFCGQSVQMKVARASLHFWEEPCISGDNGSGTVFFSGCSLRCIYCQNYKISREGQGINVSKKQISEAFIRLEKDGAHNINLVTAEHFAPEIRESVLLARKGGLSVPIILNSSGYIGESSFDILKDVIDIFLVDFKYMNKALASEYSMAEDYPDIIKLTLKKMVELHPKPIFNDKGMLQKGVVVRHLCLPHHTEDSKRVLEYVYKEYGKKVLLSIMNQYTPVCKNKLPVPLQRKLTEEEYDSVIDFCLKLGIEDAFIQEGEAASESFIPEFDGFGIK